MKKILIVTPFFVPAYSYWWIVKVAYDHAIWLIKNWFDVTVITTDVYDSKNRNKVFEEIIDWIKVIRFKNLSNHLAKFHNLYLPIWMKKWIVTNIISYDIIHIHDIYNLPTYWACKYAIKNNKKYFIQPHGTLTDIRIASRKKIIKIFILKIMWSFFKRANWWFALTQQEKEEIKNITTNENIFILPNGLYLDNFTNIETIDLHKQFNLKKNTKIICFLWRIQYIKWIDLSLIFLSELEKIFDDWIYLIIWPDEWAKQDLIELSKTLWIEKKIIWYWVENTNKKYQLLASSDLFLFTSRSEGFPMTLLEAIGCNLPVFITNTCNLPEIHEKVGIVVDINFINSKINEFKNLLENSKKYLPNMKSFLQNYDIENLITHLIKYYGN